MTRPGTNLEEIIHQPTTLRFVLLWLRSSWTDDFLMSVLFVAYHLTPSSPNTSKLTDHMTRSVNLFWYLTARGALDLPKIPHSLLQLSGALSYINPFDLSCRISSVSLTLTRIQVSSSSAYLSFFSLAWHDCYFSVINHLSIFESKLSISLLQMCDATHGSPSIFP